MICTHCQRRDAYGAEVFCQPCLVLFDDLAHPERTPHANPELLTCRLTEKLKKEIDWLLQERRLL